MQVYSPPVAHTPTRPARALGASPPWRATLASVALCAAAWLYVFPYYPALNNPNENVRVYMTAAIVEEGQYAIEGMRERWGWVNDAACVDRLAGGGRAPCDGPPPAGATRSYYSVKAPGASFLGVPGYALYRALVGPDEEPALRWAVYSMRLSGTILPTLLFLLFFHRFLGRHCRHAFVREAAFFATGLGSVMLGYGYLFASHTQSAACAFGAFMILYEARERGREGRRARVSWDSATLAGMLSAGASLFEYPCFVLSVVLCGYALVAIRPWRRLVGFAFGASVPTLLMMHFQWSAFGNPFSPGHLFVENPAFRAGHQEGFFGAESFHWDGAVALLFDGRLGLFATSPFLLVGALGGALLLVGPGPVGRRLDALVAAFGCVALYVFICFMNIWHAGWSVGPRYLVALIPFLGFASMVVLDRLAARTRVAAAGLGLGLLGASFVGASLTSMYYPHLMPELDAPVAQLMPVLIAHDYAPSNAGNLLHWFGTASMVPMLLVALLALRRALPRRTDLPSRAHRAWGLSLTLAVAGLGIAPHFLLAPEDTPESRHAVGFVCEHWSPEGHDRVSQLAAARDVTQLEERLRLLREEGRDVQADRTERLLEQRRAAERPQGAQSDPSAGGASPQAPGRGRVRGAPAGPPG